MKYFGKTVEGPNEEVLVIPRESGDIVFKARAILDFDEFDKMCPRPTPPTIRKKGGTVLDLDDRNFKLATSQYADKRMAYIFLYSLKETPGLEWDTVKLDDQNTWLNWRPELEAAGFNEREINLLIVTVAQANTLDETKVEEARQRFLQLKEEARLIELSQKDAPKNTPSGDAVNGSTSDHQEPELAGTNSESGPKAS